VLLVGKRHFKRSSNGDAHDPSAAWMVGRRIEPKKVRRAPGEEPAARELGLGTGRGGDVTGVASSYSVQREVAVAGAARGSPSEIQTFGSACDWRFTKR
jgi:hypothetical protein